MLRETCVTHVALERLGLWPVEADVTPLSIVVPAAMQVMLAVLRTCAFVPSVGLLARWGLKASAWIALPKMGWVLGW
jgi:hypothetical protein